MSNLGPGDKPEVVRRRARKHRRPRNQPSTEARKNAAYGSRPARPLPKPRPEPKPAVPAAEVRDTKSDADRGRAKDFERTPKGRKAVRDTYAEQGAKRRREIADASKDRSGPSAAEVRRFHEERVRVERAKAAAEQYLDDHKLKGPEHAEQVRKGLHVIQTQGERARARVAEQEYTSPKYSAGAAEDGEKHHNILEGITQVVKQVAGMGGGTSKAKGAVAANEVALGNLRRVEKASGPVDAEYRAALKPFIDSTTKALEQTNRVASASAGAATAAAEGKNVLKGAVEGFKSNDKSYTQLVEKLGIHGAPAVILGTAADIALDPTTYLSFGLKAPATAAERVAAQKIARKLAPQIKKAAKAGDEELQAKLAAKYEEQMAAARRKAGRLEGETRGVQAGVRLPGGRHITTKGRATAAVGKRVTRATAKAQESKAAKPLNEVLRAFAPHVRPQGVRPAEQAVRQSVKREANALRNRFAREGRQLGKFIQRATGGDVEKVREIVDAIEAGTTRNLEGPLRDAAERMREFHTRVADAFEREGLPRPRLADTVLASEDVQKALGVARDVLERRVGTAARGAERADHAADVAIAGESAPRSAAANAKVADAHSDLAAAESLAERIGSRERPLHVDEERELVGRLAGIVERLRSDAHTNMARGRTNDELGAIRRGEHAAADDADLAFHGTSEPPDVILREGLRPGDDGNFGASVYLAGKGHRVASENYMGDGGYLYGVDTRGLKLEGGGSETLARGGVPAENLRLLPVTRATIMHPTKVALEPILARTPAGKALAKRLDSPTADITLTADEARVLHDALGGIEHPAAERLGHALGRWLDDFEEYGSRPRPGDIREALRAEDFFKRRAADQRKGGNRRAARASEAKAREARAIIKAFRQAAEPQHLADVQSEGGNVLKGRAGHLERLLGQLQERVAHEPPVDYVPRQTQAAMAAEAEGKPLLVPAHPQGKAGFERERLERRRAEDVHASNPDYLSDELPQIEAKYGIKMGRRLASAALWRRMVQQTARPVTGEFPIEADNVLYRLEGGQPKRIDPADKDANVQAVAEAALRHGLGEDTGVFAVPKQIDKDMQERLRVGEERSAAGRLYDKWLRGFKAVNTVLRPGFFATTIAGNTWQQFLADVSPKEMADAWRMLAHMRSADLKAIDPQAGAGFRGEAGGRVALLDRIAGDQTYVVDGRAVKFSDLFDEAIDAGVVRTGSRIGDPTELTLEEQAGRRLGKGAKAKAAQAQEWLGEVAEDLDDMTKAIVYVNARTKLGMDPRAAAERTFTKMIDYSDLSTAERTVFKRIMPFYVYTARNLPIQVKSLLARPGKLANFQKVRDALAEAAGLPDDWEGQRTEAEQERMPVALPGVKSHGFQVFLDPRLPVADLAAPAQLGEGPGGAVRMLERYGSGVAPPVKVPLELLLFKRRLDYDRPIDVPGSPPAAGALLKLIGATKDGTYVQPATGEKYTGAIPAVDYLLRSLGGSPGSLVASVGADVPDRSNLDPKARAAASFAGGFGLSASDPLYAALDSLRRETEKHYEKRSELKGQGKRDSAEDIRNEDTIDALNNIKAKIQAAIGFPEQKAKGVFGLEKDRLEIDTREPAEMRAERRRLEALRRQYGG